MKQTYPYEYKLNKLKLSETPEECDDYDEYDDIEPINFDDTLSKLWRLAPSFPQRERYCIAMSLCEARLEVCKRGYPIPIMKLLLQFYEAVEWAIYPEREFSWKKITDK
jgi:hypothetical protein